MTAKLALEANPGTASIAILLGASEAFETREIIEEDREP